MSAEVNKNQLHFVKLWCDPKITTIEQFITAASASSDIDFTRTSSGDGSKEDNSLIAADAAKCRQDCARYIFGSGSGISEKRKDPDAVFPFDDRFRIWESRRGDEPKWHIRFLRRESIVVDSVKKTGSDAFDEFFKDDNVNLSWK